MNNNNKKPEDNEKLFLVENSLLHFYAVIKREL